MDGLTVTTTAGPVRGILANGVRCWRGIPYARADRFAAPEAPVAWNDVRDASRPGPQCPQMYGNQAKRARLSMPDFAEDCLSLNIHVPDGATGPLPVYVWVHGGA